MKNLKIRAKIIKKKKTLWLRNSHCQKEFKLLFNNQFEFRIYLLTFNKIKKALSLTLWYKLFCFFVMELNNLIKYLFQCTFYQLIPAVGTLFINVLLFLYQYGFFSLFDKLWLLIQETLWGFNNSFANVGFFQALFRTIFLTSFSVFDGYIEEDNTWCFAVFAVSKCCFCFYL